MNVNNHDPGCTGTAISAGTSIFPVACHYPQLVAFHWSKVQINLMALRNALVLITAAHIAQSIGKLANQIMVGQQAKADHCKEGINQK
jgi:hypothetical protein